MRTMMNRIAATAVAVACLAFGCGAAWAQAPSDLLVRIDQLENQVRQLTGLLEQEHFRNQQLDAALKRMQDDYEYRFQQLGVRGASRVPPRPSAIGAPPPGPIGAPPPGPIAAPPPGPIGAAPPVVPPAPVAAAAPPGRRSDAFDPNEHPGAPGAPRALGSLYSSAPLPRNDRNDVGAPVPEETPIGGRAPCAPLDLAGVAAPGTVPPPRASGATGTYATATAPPSATSRDAFDLGYGYVQHRDYALAEETFRDFLKRSPSDRLAGDAQYWLGESLFQRQAFRDAADAFLVMSKKYEISVKAPDALLRLGESLAAIKEKELACATFGEVLRKYPRASTNVKQAVDREQKREHC
jgi:tol-pal system protein YbgF